MDERRAIYLGSSGSGKSYALQAVSDCPPPGRSIWLVDLLGTMRQPAHPRAHLIRPTKEDMQDGDAPYWEFIDGVCLDAITTRNVHVHIDEVSLACVGPAAPHYLRELALRGRHTGNGWIFTGQTPGTIPGVLRGQVNEYAVFRTSEPAHLKWMGEIGADKYVVRRLQRGEFVHVVGGESHPHRHILSPCSPQET